MSDATIILLLTGGPVTILVLILGADLSRINQVLVVLSITALLMLFLVAIIDPMGKARKGENPSLWG